LALAVEVADRPAAQEAVREAGVHQLVVAEALGSQGGHEAVRLGRGVAHLGASGVRLQHPDVDPSLPEVVRASVAKRRVGVVAPSGVDCRVDPFWWRAVQVGNLGLAGRPGARRRAGPCVLWSFSGGRCLAGPCVGKGPPGVEDADGFAPVDAFGLAHPFDDIAFGSAAEAGEDAVVEVKAQRGGPVRVAVGG